MVLNRTRLVVAVAVCLLFASPSLAAGIAPPWGNEPLVIDAFDSGMSLTPAVVLQASDLAVTSSQTGLNAQLAILNPLPPPR